MKKFFSQCSTQRNVLLALILFCVIFIVYGNSFSNTFLWDDEAGILTNKYVHEWKYFLNFFSEGMYSGSESLSYYWRPMVLSLFSIEWHIFHEWVAGYHFANTLLHAINSVLIFYLFRLIFKREMLAFMAALIFAVHPLQTTAITYISSIADPLSGLFMLLGVYSYAKSRTDTDNERLLFLVTFLSFIFALLTKESAIMMPGLLFLADLFVKKNAALSWRDVRASLQRIAPFLCVLTVYIISRLTVLDFMKDLPPSPLALPLYERMLTFFHAFSVYLRLIFAPLHLHMEWALPIAKTIFSVPVAIGGLFVFIFLALIITQYKKRPEVSFGLSWFLVALSPNMNIFIPTTAFLSENWLYLSLPGFFLALFALFEEWSRRWPYRPLLFAIFFAWVVWLGSLAVLRNRDWADPITFFTATLKEAPRSYRANVNLGTSYRDLGNYPMAFAYYERAIVLLPNEAITYYERATLYEKMGRKDDAILDHEHSFMLAPLYSPSFRVLVDYFMSRGEYEKASEILETRLKNTTNQMETQKLLSELFSTAVGEKNTALKKEYMERAAATEMKIKNNPLVQFGTWLNNHASP